MSSTQLLVLACASQALLTLCVCIIMLIHRIHIMKKYRIAPQSVALSAERLQHYKDTRLSDNYNHLFELPVLFYTLCVLAIACQHISNWLVYAAWGFVLSRVVHSIIQCTYNKVMHRFTVFVFGIFLIASMWVGFILSYLNI